MLTEIKQVQQLEESEKNAAEATAPKPLKVVADGGELLEDEDVQGTSNQWNCILKDADFIDCETTDISGERVLKQRATNAYRQADELERDTRLQYYSLLGHLAHNTKFDSQIEQLIMIRHSEGAEIKEIVEEIKLTGSYRCRKMVLFIIRRWQMRWGVKTWSLKEMNLRRPLMK